MTAPDVPPPAPDRKVVDFPQAGTSEDAVRRQVAEVERLANFSLAEALLWAPSSAERLGVPAERLIAAVKARQAEKATSWTQIQCNVITFCVVNHLFYNAKCTAYLPSVHCLCSSPSPIPAPEAARPQSQALHNVP
jgi:hypothetical protein